MDNENMTASQLLRDCVDKCKTGGSSFPIIYLLKELGGKTGSYTLKQHIAFLKLANKIDEEVEQAASYKVLKIFAAGSANEGKPLREGEGIKEWINRWYLPRPVFEDGTPAQFMDEVVFNGDKYRTDSILMDLNGAYYMVTGYIENDIKLMDAALKRPQSDTQEAIDADAKLDPATYCRDILDNCSEALTEDLRRALMNHDLLRRQRKLDRNLMGGSNE